MREKFNFEAAVALWTEVYTRGFDNWECPDEVVRIAAMCGLGVLTIEAKNDAVKAIRNDYCVNGRYSRELYNRLLPSVCAPKWANYLLAAAMRYPPGKDDYPMRARAPLLPGRTA